MKYLLILMCALMMFCGCDSEQSSNEGSGSEIVGTVDSGDGSRVVRKAVDAADIYIFSVDYKANGNERVATYSLDNGSFSIADVDPGTWIVEASTGKKSLVKSCIVKGDGKKVDLKSMHIEKPASLSVSINTDIPLGVPIKYTLYVLGTRVKASGNRDELKFDIPNIPTGIEHNLLLKITEPLLPVSEFRQKITLPAGANVNTSFTVPKL